MALPVQSVRAKPEHRAMLQNVADLLRTGREMDVRALLDGVHPKPVGPFRNEEAAIAFLRDRLVADPSRNRFGCSAAGRAAMPVPTVISTCLWCCGTDFPTTSIRTMPWPGPLWHAV